MKASVLKRLATLAFCTAVVCGTALAANTVCKNISVYYTGIKLVVDGVAVTPKDANGAVVEPFTYNGTTYLPVRAVGDAIGRQVTWDATTQTVYLGDVPNQTSYLLDVCPPYEKKWVQLPTSFKMTGKTYSHGFTIGNYQGLYGTPGSYALFNLDGKYQTLSVDIGHVDGEGTGDASFEIYLDGDLTQVIEVGYEDMVSHFDISLNHALQLKIVKSDSNWGYYGFANAVLS